MNTVEKQSATFRMELAKDMIWRGTSALQSAIQHAIDDPATDTGAGIQAAVSDFEAWLMEMLGFVRKAVGVGDPPPNSTDPGYHPPPDPPNPRGGSGSHGSDSGHN